MFCSTTFDEYSWYINNCISVYFLNLKKEIIVTRCIQLYLLNIKSESFYLAVPRCISLYLGA